MLVCKDQHSSVCHRNKQRGDCDPACRNERDRCHNSGVNLCKETPGLCHLPGALCWTVTLIRLHKRETMAMVTPGTSRGSLVTSQGWVSWSGEEHVGVSLPKLEAELLEDLHHTPTHGQGRGSSSSSGVIQSQRNVHSYSWHSWPLQCPRCLPTLFWPWHLEIFVLLHSPRPASCDLCCPTAWSGWR